MGKWEKPSEELIALLNTLLEPFECNLRKMFGSVAYFVNGNMFAGVFEDTIFMRYDIDTQKELKEKNQDVENFDPMGGRPMKEYLILPNLIIENIPELENWLELSYTYAKNLPPKQKK